jgi:hypothetical protein
VEWSKHAVNLLPTDLNDELRHDLNKAQQMQIFGDYHLPFIRREKRPDGGFVIEIYILNQQYRKVLKERSEFDDRGQRNGSRIVIFNNCGTYLESIYCHGTQMMECIRRVRDHEILENRRPQQDAWITIS